jgi:hypothetical protein
MKNQKLILSFILSSLMFLSSCENVWWDCIRGNHRIATERRNTGSFTSIASYGSFVINVSFGAEPSLSITADENLLPYIRTYIKGRTLILETRDNRCIESSEAIVINVTTSEIDKLKLSGSGIINCDYINTSIIDIELSGSGLIKCESLNVSQVLAELSGSGIIELEGTAETADLTVSGSGVFKGIQLETEDCYASIPGSGIIYILVNHILDVNISGSGSVYYEGDPIIKKHITGSGNVRNY